MNEHLFTVIQVYLIVFALSGLLFYSGAIRGRARKPEIMSVLFSLFWFITLPLLLWQVIKAFKEDRTSKQ